MRLTSMNLRFGGQSRTDSILNYIKNQNPNILVLGEYKDDPNGQKIKTTLQEEGFYFEESGDDVLGVLVASKHPFTTTDKSSRWVEIELKDNDLKVLGVYVPTGSGDKEFKDSFWQEILNYAQENQDKNCIITGDFNSCGKKIQ